MRRVAAVAFALLLGACTSGQDPTVDAGGDPAASPSTGPGSATSIPVTGPTSVVPPVSTPPVATKAHLTGVRASAATELPGGSRVVFEFDAVVPGYRIHYVQRPVTEDGSGDEVTVDGTAVLEVRFENAAGARLDGERVVRTYTGPERVAATGGQGVVTEVVDAGDFEGLLTWVIGLRAKVPALSVSTLSGPHRLVIDLPPAPAAP